MTDKVNISVPVEDIARPVLEEERKLAEVLLNAEHSSEEDKELAEQVKDCIDFLLENWL